MIAANVWAQNKILVLMQKVDQICQASDVTSSDVYVGVVNVTDMLTVINYETVNKKAATMESVTITQKMDDSNNKLQCKI